MKILYVKNGSDRRRKFQLKTLIYEENGQKFVKKQALCPEAVSHLKTMKDSYAKLTASILNPKIKLAKIIDESSDSLTFEFIDGISFEKKFNAAQKSNNNESSRAIDDYTSLLETGFKTTLFDSATMVTDEHIELFGDLDYSKFDGALCFDGISNSDLIFSNIIFKNDSIYLIDYEWVFELNLPLEYSLFRSLAYSSAPNQHESLSTEMFKSLQIAEDHFLTTIYPKESFARTQSKYMKGRFLVSEKVQEKEREIQEKEREIQEKEREIQYWQDTAQSLRLKNRFLRIVKKFTPK